MKTEQSAKAANQVRPGLIRRLHNSGRGALTATFSVGRRSLLIPCALGLLVSASLLACGSDEPHPQTVSDQPLATQMVTEATSKSNGKNPSTDTGGQNNGDNTNPPVTTESDGQNPPEMPTATTPPPATATPTPEPTATPVPTPTPDPRVVMMELLTERQAPHIEAPLRHPEIYNHNHEIIAPILAEKAVEQFEAYREEDAAWLTKGQWGVRIHNGLIRSPMTFERINEESPDLHVKITVTFEHEHPTREDVTYIVTANAVMEAVLEEGTSIPILPVFSHLTSDPVIERQ